MRCRWIPAEVTRIEISGELDMSNAEQIVTQLVRVSAETAHLVVDLRSVYFLDSSAMAGLTRLRRTLDADGTRLSIVLEPEGIVHRVIVLSRMDQMLDVRFPDVVEQ